MRKTLLSPQINSIFNRSIITELKTRIYKLFKLPPQGLCIDGRKAMLMELSRSESTWANLWSVVLECTISTVRCTTTIVPRTLWTTTLYWMGARSSAASLAWQHVVNITTLIIRQASFIWVAVMFLRLKCTGVSFTTWKLLTATLECLCCILTKVRPAYLKANWTFGDKQYLL